MAYNTIFKRYPCSDLVQIKTYSWAIEEGQERNVRYDESSNEKRNRALDSQRNSMRRTKNAVYDIARANEDRWELFVTLTFNPEKVNSFDYDITCRKLSNYLHRLRKNNPDLVYLGVPEQHKSGRYHFHFLMGNCENLKLVDSGHKTRKGQVIYNVGSYRLGFSTATRIENTQRVCSYITKYLTKELCTFTKNKKRYWCSKNVFRPTAEKFMLNLEDYNFEDRCEYHKHIDVKNEQSMEIYETRSGFADG